MKLTAYCGMIELSVNVISNFTICVERKICDLHFCPFSVILSETLVNFIMILHEITEITWIEFEQEFMRKYWSETWFCEMIKIAFKREFSMNMNSPNHQKWVHIYVRIGLFTVRYRIINKQLIRCWSHQWAWLKRSGISVVVRASSAQKASCVWPSVLPGPRPFASCKGLWMKPWPSHHSPQKPSFFAAFWNEGSRFTTFGGKRSL